MTTMKKKFNKSRSDAIDQLQEANKIIKQGRGELLAAQEKIDHAQRLIIESAKILREAMNQRCL